MGQSAKSVYAELTIAELIAEDPNRGSDKMSAHAAVGGFVTEVAKGSDGDTDVRICENPKIEGMDQVNPPAHRRSLNKLDRSQVPLLARETRFSAIRWSLPLAPKHS